MKTLLEPLKNTYIYDIIEVSRQEDIPKICEVPAGRSGRILHNTYIDNEETYTNSQRRTHNLMRRATLDHPSRPILIHVPATSLEHLDNKAREAQLSRSEIIRQLLAPPAELASRKTGSVHGGSATPLQVQTTPRGRLG
jgi:Ribbon-helix-helix protein, copG family